MSSSEFGIGDESSSDSSIPEEDGGAFVEESFFGPKPWEDAPLTQKRLESVVRKWVCDDWKLRPGQFEVVNALRPKGHVFCGFPTAAGKTLIACANALLDYVAGVEGVHVICQPLQALVGQTAANLTTLYFARTRIEVVIWDKLSREVVADIDFRSKVVVILSSPEELDSVFVTCDKLHARVRGLMVDEAHLRDEWPFRNYLASDRFTTKYPNAMVGIFSASLDDTMVTSFKESMALFDSVVFDRSNVPVLRALEVTRLNQLVIRCCPLSSLRRSILTAVDNLDAGDAIVVFASTYDVLSRNHPLLFCSEIAHLNPRMYAATFEPTKKEETVKLFQDRTCRFVISTCAFGTGVDFPHIRHVFFGQHVPCELTHVRDSGCDGRSTTAGDDTFQKDFVLIRHSHNRRHGRSTRSVTSNHFTPHQQSMPSPKSARAPQDKVFSRVGKQAKTRAPARRGLYEHAAPCKYARVWLGYPLVSSYRTQHHRLATIAEKVLGCNTKKHFFAVRSLSTQQWSLPTR
jgi:hypothetical protein